MEHIHLDESKDMSVLQWCRPLELLQLHKPREWSKRHVGHSQTCGVSAPHSAYVPAQFSRICAKQDQNQTCYI